MHKVRELLFYLYNIIKCWTEDLRVFILVVQVRAVKIYVVAEEALGIKQRQDET